VVPRTQARGLQHRRRHHQPALGREAGAVCCATISSAVATAMRCSSAAPWMPQVIVALFRSESAPAGARVSRAEGVVPVDARAEPARACSRAAARATACTPDSPDGRPSNCKAKCSATAGTSSPRTRDDLQEEHGGLWQELVQRAEKRPSRGNGGGGPQMKSPAVGGAVSPETRAAPQERRSIKVA
jgi:hypothetical protein